MNFAEFFQDDNGRMSMSRLLCFMSFFPASYALFSINNESALGWYVGAYVLGYVGGKGADVFKRNKEREDVDSSTH